MPRANDRHTQMSIGYALAVAVLDGAAMVKQFVPFRINRDDVWAMLARIEVNRQASRSIETPGSNRLSGTWKNRTT